MAAPWSSFLFLVVVIVSIQALPTPDRVVEVMRAMTHEDPSLSYSVSSIHHRPGAYKLSFGPYRNAFEDFKRKYDVYYDSDSEETYRFSVFQHNVKLMEANNLHYHNGNRSFFQDVNQFSDKTLEEFRVYNRLGRYSNNKRLMSSAANGDVDRMFSICGAFTPSDQSSDPASVDWRQKGKVTAIKDQGQCGSCWTFSTTGSVEGSFAVLTGRLLSLSEQQIVDCCQFQGCSGCNGGFMDTAFSYVNMSGGLESERDYSYVAQDDQCHFKSSQVKVRVTGCADIPGGNEAALKNAVARYGPISVAIDANSQDFQAYGGGVYYNAECSPTDLDHGVLVVGYGSLHGNDFWIVKNSWSANWGLNGYILMSRNQNNNCGIASMASFPYTAKP